MGSHRRDLFSSLQFRLLDLQSFVHRWHRPVQAEQTVELVSLP